MCRAAALDVQTTGAMTRLATDVLRILPLRFQPRVSRRSEVARDRFVAGCAFLRTDKLRAGNAGRRENRSVSRAAGKQNHRECDYSPGTPQQALAPTVDPSSYSRTPHESRVCTETKNRDNAFLRFFRYGFRNLPMRVDYTLSSPVFRRRFTGKSFENAIKL